MGNSWRSGKKWVCSHTCGRVGEQNYGVKLVKNMSPLGVMITSKGMGITEALSL